MATKPRILPPELLRSPLWGALLDRTEAEISNAGARPGESRTSPLEAAKAAAARAHSRFLLALEDGSSAGSNLVSELVEAAARLVVAVAELAETAESGPGEHRAELADRLRRCLSAHEDDVLAGEITYGVQPEHGEAPAVRIRQAAASLSRNGATSKGDLLSLRIGVVDLASLLIRAAANAAAGGGAAEAPEKRSAALDASLGAITLELAARADEVERPVDERADIVAHHLAAGLRVRVSHEALERVRTGSAGVPADRLSFDGARDAWLRLATHEYVAVTALDGQLDTPTYADRFGGLAAAIVEGAANVICGARLVRRPDAFRHRRAWGHQAIALSYALEAYVAGLRGHAPSLGQTQLITLTRLVRAAAAIALLDLRRADHGPGNGGSKR